MMTVRILATGGRDYANRVAVAAMLDYIASLFPGVAPGELVLVHGDCKRHLSDGSVDEDRSADQLAAQEAAKRGWRVEPHPVEWDTMPPSEWSAAGRARNQHMVDLGAEVCAAFPGGSGTGHCRRAAERAGIRVIRLAEVPR